MQRQRLRILYSGHVQGVGFRYTVRGVAQGFEVVGLVRNLTDGRVELIAEGDPGELEAFRQAIRESGLEPHIRHEEVHREPARGGLSGFVIGR
ncbi:MAG: acylphosphatase [Verrucomicrobiae bacterium]|nr:acylphosphatase [Verrucomicrobiae bacterium]MCP5523923.1 acylphosphatase [Verrucomicrobiales bacterium]